jgi:thiol:disulfide interchange protein DsbD
LALAIWIWGQFVQRGSRRRGVALAFSLILIAFAYGYALEKELDWRHPAQVASGGVKNKKGGIPWEPWSAEGVAQARSAGKVVLVDFTADWCVTCQANKKSSLEIASVRNKLKEIDAAAFLGDYTREDPRITEELKRFQRAGVPLVLVYPKNSSAEPIVLPPFLTPGIVLEALEKASREPQVSAIAK